MLSTFQSENDREEEMYIEIERVKFSSVLQVFRAWLFRRKLLWHSDRLKVNGKEIKL